MKAHEYAIALAWEGNTGRGTADYAAYSREFRAMPVGKAAVVGSADPTFRGDKRLQNPEEMLVMSLSSCHMLSYLALCSLKKIRVLAYTDTATGRMAADRTGGKFEEVVLHPRVVIAEGDDLAAAQELHEQAHAGCYIASSVNFPVRHDATVVHGTVELAKPRVDLAVRLPDRPGALAEFGQIMGDAGVSLEGGGGFGGTVHFLVRNPDAAMVALLEYEPVVREIIQLRLDQEKPGQLGSLARALGDAGVNIECVYSDHDHQLILVVDDVARARAAIVTWST